MKNIQLQEFLNQFSDDTLVYIVTNATCEPLIQTVPLVGASVFTGGVLLYPGPTGYESAPYPGAVPVGAK